MRYVLQTARSIAPYLVLVTLVACAKTNTLSLPSPSSQLATVTSDYPYAVKVILPGGGGLCSGTFVSPRAVLTAAHCTQRSGTYTVTASFGTFTTSTRVNYGGPATVDDPNDIAFLIFSSDVADPDNGEVANLGTSVRRGDTIRLIGFGCTDLYTRRGSGVKRTGTNMVYDVTDYIELITPPTSSRGIIGAENRAGSCFGDSGGPATLNGQVVGVAHAGGEIEDGFISDYVDMTRSDNRAFVAAVNNAYNLDIVGY